VASAVSSAGSKSGGGVSGAKMEAIEPGTILDTGPWGGNPANTPGFIYDFSLIPSLTESQLQADIKKLTDLINWLNTSSAQAATKANRQQVYAPAAQQMLNWYNAEVRRRAAPAAPASSAGTNLPAPDNKTTNPNVGGTIGSAQYNKTTNPNVGGTIGSAQSGISTMALMIFGGIILAVIAAVLLIVLL